MQESWPSHRPTADRSGRRSLYRLDYNRRGTLHGHQRSRRTASYASLSFHRTVLAVTRFAVILLTPIDAPLHLTEVKPLRQMRVVG